MELFKTCITLAGGILMLNLGGPAYLGAILIAASLVNFLFNEHITFKRPITERPITLDFFSIIKNSLILTSAFFVFKLGGPIVLGVLLATTAGVSIFSSAIAMKNKINIMVKKNYPENSVNFGNVDIAIGNNQRENNLNRNIDIVENIPREPNPDRNVEVNVENIPREPNPGRNVEGNIETPLS